MLGGNCSPCCGSCLDINGWVDRAIERGELDELRAEVGVEVTALDTLEILSPMPAALEPFGHADRLREPGVDLSFSRTFTMAPSSSSGKAYSEDFTEQGIPYRLDFGVGFGTSWSVSMTQFPETEVFTGASPSWRRASTQIGIGAQCIPKTSVAAGAYFNPYFRDNQSYANTPFVERVIRQLVLDSRPIVANGGPSTKPWTFIVELGGEQIYRTEFDALPSDVATLNLPNFRNAPLVVMTSTSTARSARLHNLCQGNLGFSRFGNTPANVPEVSIECDIENPAGEVPLYHGYGTFPSPVFATLPRRRWRMNVRIKVTSLTLRTSTSAIQLLMGSSESYWTREATNSPNFYPLNGPIMLVFGHADSSSFGDRALPFLFQDKCVTWVPE